MTTVSKTGRVYRRKYDHEEAIRLVREEGLTYRQVAARLGVGRSAIDQLMQSPETRARAVATRHAWMMSATCERCGGPRARDHLHNGAPSDGLKLCKVCRDIARIMERFRVEDGVIVAAKCRSGANCVAEDCWQPLENFPGDRRSATIIRENGIHHYCRRCQTAQRRRVREQSKVPCSHGCGRMVEPPAPSRYPDKAPECVYCYRERLTREGRLPRAA